MSTPTITLDADGRGAVTIDGTEYPVASHDLLSARAAARQAVVEHARRAGGPVTFTVTEPDGTHQLIAYPDGRVEAPPAAPQATPVDPELAEEERRPATTGMRGRLNRSLGMSLSPGPAELEERREQYRARQAQVQEEHAQESRQAQRHRAAAEAARAERALIQTNHVGTRTILVANPKGGARKTTSTWLLAHTMGTIRGGAVIAWDANETMGTLSDRGVQDRHSGTVVDLIEKAAPSFGSVEGIRLGALDAYVRPQGDSHFDLLASDEDPTRQDIVGADNFRAVHEILSRFYRLILLDTGNNIRASHFAEALEHTDQLVIPVAAGRDSAAVAQRMMRALHASGHGDLVRRAVVLLHDLEPAESADPGYLHIAQEIASDLTPQVSAVIPVPFDPALKEGARIEPTALTEATLTAYRQAAAAVSQSLIAADTH